MEALTHGNKKKSVEIHIQHLFQSNQILVNFFRSRSSYSPPHSISSMDDYDHDEVPKMRRPSAERLQRFRNDLLTSTLKRGKTTPTPNKPFIKMLYSTSCENRPSVNVKFVRATAKILDKEDFVNTEKPTERYAFIKQQLFSLYYWLRWSMRPRIHLNK